MSFCIIYSVAEGSGEVQWPQIWDLLQIPPHGRRGFESRTAEIFTGYPKAKVHISEISYKLSCGPVAEGFSRRTLASNFEPPKFNHVDDAGSSPVGLEILTGYLMAKALIC